MLHAVGFDRSDFEKSQIGVASTWSQVTPCNAHIDQFKKMLGKPGAPPPQVRERLVQVV